MSFTTKFAAGVMLAAATSTALTGCGKKSSTNTSSSSMSSTSSVKSTPSMSTTPSMTSSTSSTKAGYVTGTINGHTKYLRAGDQCQSKYASQYTQYGFTCAPKTSGGTAYYLTKN